MKLRIHFGEETRFDVPKPQKIKTWEQLVPGLRLSLRRLALAELPKPIKHRFD